MKKLFLLLSFICYIANVCAQTDTTTNRGQGGETIVPPVKYEYFPINMVWKSDYQVANYSDNTTQWESNIYVTQVEGDTIIDNRYYQIIGGVPVRVEDNRVYFRIRLYDIIEFDELVYDFNLEVGDTIDWKNYGYPKYTTSRVIKTDSVTLLDGRKAKRIFYDNRGTDIEYIGCVSETDRGLFGSVIAPTPDNARWQFLCCSVDGMPLYQTSEESCEKSAKYIYRESKYVNETTSVNNITKSELTILQNPVHDILTINSTETLDHITIYNLSGQCVLTTTQTQINVSALPEGMYLLQAINTERDSKQIKFIKH